MITKALVVSSDFRTNTVKIRIPVLNKMAGAVGSTADDDLPDATVCVPVNFTPNFRKGDVVWVSNEDNDWSKPIILGSLYMSEGSETLGDLILDDITVRGVTALEGPIMVGTVNRSNILTLANNKKNIKDQLDLIASNTEVTAKVVGIPYDGEEGDIPTLSLIDGDGKDLLSKIGDIGNRINGIEKMQTAYANLIAKQAEELKEMSDFVERLSNSGGETECDIWNAQLQTDTMINRVKAMLLVKWIPKEDVHVWSANVPPTKSGSGSPADVQLLMSAANSGNSVEVKKSVTNTGSLADLQIAMHEANKSTFTYKEYKAGVMYQGIPYNLSYNVGPETFFTDWKKIKTAPDQTYGGYGKRAHCNTGNCCASFVSYANNMVDSSGHCLTASCGGIWAMGSKGHQLYDGFFERGINARVEDLRSGDMCMDSGHVVICLQSVQDIGSFTSNGFTGNVYTYTGYVKPSGMTVDSGGKRDLDMYENLFPWISLNYDRNEQPHSVALLAGDIVRVVDSNGWKYFKVVQNIQNAVSLPPDRNHYSWSGGRNIFVNYYQEIPLDVRKNLKYYVQGAHQGAQTVPLGSKGSTPGVASYTDKNGIPEEYFLGQDYFGNKTKLVRMTEAGKIHFRNVLGTEGTTDLLDLSFKNPTGI